MRVLVVSDTHGHFNGIEAIKNQHDILPFDEMWHLGDHDKDGSILSKALGIPSFSVKGNCDPLSHGHEQLILYRHGVKVLLTHGHLYGVKSSLTQLYYRALESDVNLVCFGHTHLALHCEEDQIHFFNPGSLSKPYPNDAASYGVITLDSNQIAFEIVSL